MNKALLAGRLTRDPEMKYSTGTNATAITRFSIAINRKFKNAEGNYESDFINCVAFGKTAEFISKYFSKGSMIGICGRIQTGSYTNDKGVKIYTTDVVVEDAEFLESKKSQNNDNSYDNSYTEPSTTDFDDDELPFE